MKLPLTDAEFRLIYSKVPRLNVEIVITTEEGLVLTRRNINPWSGYWHLPGGTVHMGESLEDAVERIALDEVGLVVTVNELLGSITYPSIVEQKGLGWPVGIAFKATVVSGTLQTNENAEAVQTFTSLPEKVIPEQKRFIENMDLL